MACSYHTNSETTRHGRVCNPEISSETPAATQKLMHLFFVFFVEQLTLPLLKLGHLQPFTLLLHPYGIPL